MDDIDDVNVFLGLDVGKSAHHGHGLTAVGKKVLASFDVFDGRVTRIWAKRNPEKLRPWAREG